jgi:hypothetical protein
MATEMDTFVTIKNGNKQVAEKLREIFQPNEGEWTCYSTTLANRLYGTNYTWNDKLKYGENEELGNTAPDIEWMGENIGANWIYSVFTYNDQPELIDLKLTTPYAVPQGFLNKLAEVLSEVKSDCYIVGTYEDEIPQTVGAFVYAWDYEDIEDDDSGVVEDILEQMESDEEIEDVDFNGDVIQFANGWDWFSGSPNGREEMHNSLQELQVSLEEAYLEFVQDKKDNPEDYED